MSAAIGFPGGLGLAAQEAGHGHGVKAALWVLFSLACLGVLIAPVLLMRSAKRRSGPPGRHGDGSVKY